MGAYLDEDMVAHEPDFVAYPHLVLCMGVTLLMSDGSVLGGHVVDQGSQDIVLPKMLALAQGAAIAGVTIDRLYLTGDTAVHIQFAGDAHAKARALGYTGTVYVFDTGSIQPTNGTFVRVTSRGAGRHPAIHYKRDEKVLYNSGARRLADVRGRMYTDVRRIGHSMRPGSSINTLTTSGFFNKLTEVRAPH